MKTTTKSALKLHPLKPLPPALRVHGTHYISESVAHTGDHLDYVIYKDLESEDRLKVENK